MKRFSNYFVTLWAIIVLCITMAVVLISYNYGHAAIPFMVVSLVLFIVGANTSRRDVYRRGES